MLFNSHAFTFLFLPIVIFLFVFLSIRNIPQKFLFYTIIAASLVFVLIGDFLSLALLLTSLFCNYAILHKLSSTESEDRRRYLLIFGIVFNLSFIGVFKYADFFLVNLNYFLAEDIALLQDRLPLAISFYTFQLIALLVDSWKDRRPCLPPERLALFVSFFPQLIAGPIVRYQEVEKDLGRLGIIDLRKMATGASIFFIGLFKKTVIADNLAPIANIFYSAVEKGQSPSFFEAWRECWGKEPEKATKATPVMEAKDCTSSGAGEEKSQADPIENATEKYNEKEKSLTKQDNHTVEGNKNVIGAQKLLDLFDEPKIPIIQEKSKDPAVSQTPKKPEVKVTEVNTKEKRAQKLLNLFEEPTNPEFVTKSKTHDITERAIEAIENAGKTGKIGDGKIFVSDLTEVIRIRTGETGKEAL